MVTTQDVSFGSLWLRLLGSRARWEPGSDHVSPFAVQAEPLVFGMGLVAVWVAGEGPVLVCKPKEGLAAIKNQDRGTDPELLRQALRDAGAVAHEDARPRNDSTSESAP